MGYKQRLMYGALAGVALFAANPAAADPADDKKLEQLQKQIDMLQQQLQSLHREVVQTRKQAAAPAAAVAPGATPLPTKAAPIPFLGGVNIKVGGFIEAAGIWRQRNEVSDVGDPGFSALPFSNSPLYHENELRFSARQSRISLLASGDMDPVQHLAAYFETDFLGAGVTANSRESNSYNLRVRHAFLSYDNDDWHFHMLAGQSWSLLTQDRVGIVPLKENIPLTIDAQYVVGFNWARQPQIRFVEDWNKVAWFGVSVESPQVNFVSNGVFPFSGASGAANFGGSPLPPGITINDLSACQAGGLLDSATSCSSDELPDIVEKFALDPGWGHYEVVGLQRFFTDRAYTTAIAGSGTNQTHAGWGVGGSLLVPVWPKFVDFQASVLTGEGLGRYGSSQLADVTIGPDGSLTPLQTTQVLLGLVAHPAPTLDIYAYAGQEQVNSNFWTVGGTPGGYGNPSFVNNGCLNENQAGGSVGFNTAITGTTCTANVRRVQELTVGFWDNIYKGDMGRLAFGMQYEYVKIDAFPGPATGAGTPNQGLSPDNNIFMTSLRYYPFN